MLAICAPVALAGVLLLTLGTRVRFNKPPDHITVTGGPSRRSQWPRFWRKSVLSRSQAAEASVVRHVIDTSDGYVDSYRTAHEVAAAGRTVYRGDASQARELAERLRQFGEYAAYGSV